ncbi:MAG: hypothetical protein R2695_19895 [Acidimicrobiales bacterium]
MAVDLSGGLGDELEFVFATQPDDPDMRESINAWIWDDGDGLPLAEVEAVADQWATRRRQPQHGALRGPGRGVLRARRRSDFNDGARPGGRTDFFEVVEPSGLLRLWFDGTARIQSVDDQIGGAFPGAGRPHRGGGRHHSPGSSPGGSTVPRPRPGGCSTCRKRGDLDGASWRFEQLCRATWYVRVTRSSRSTAAPTASAVRASAAWRSSALLPGRPRCSRSGQLLHAYPPRSDGKANVQRRYLFDGDVI